MCVATQLLSLLFLCCYVVILKICFKNELIFLKRFNNPNKKNSGNMGKINYGNEKSIFIMRAVFKSFYCEKFSVYFKLFGVDHI